MAIADDISVAANGDIRYTGAAHEAAGAGYYTVIEFHRFLQDLADDASASGDDLLDITDDTPSDRSTDNIITVFSPYNIDQTLSEHLYDGSIIQNDGDDVWDGIVNYGNEGINIQIIQNGSLITNDFWNSTPNGEATSGLNRSISSGISHRFMVKTVSSGTAIDNRRLIGISREYSKTYSEFVISATSRGNNVLALTNATDLNNQTAEGTVSGWAITNTEGYRDIDVNNDGTVEHYYSEWNRDVQTINGLYEYTKYITRNGTSETLYGIDAGIFRGITHEIPVDTPSGTFSNVESVSWTGGTGQMLAINSTTAPTKMWIQLLTGTPPSDGTTITGGTSGATCDVNGSTTERSINPEFIGVSTGSAIIGNYGVGVEATDLSASDKVKDLDGNVIVPPNYVTFTVGGLVSGEDRVLVAPESSGGIEEDQLSLNGAITSGATSITVNETIPSDTPSSGTIRIFNGDTYSRVRYDSYSGSTFDCSTYGGTDTPAASDSSNVFISYIDVLASGSSEHFTAVYSADRSLFIRVRDGGASPIKTFETTGTLGSAGGSTTAIRTSDA